MAILSSNGMKIDPLHLRTLIRWSDNVDIAKKELSLSTTPSFHFSNFGHIFRSWQIKQLQTFRFVYVS